MNSRIDTVQTMGQYPYSRKPAGQSCTMGMHVNAVSQTTNHQYIGTQLGKVSEEIGTEAFTVICRPTRTYHANYPQAVQVGISLKKQYDGGIFTIAQT